VLLADFWATGRARNPLGFVRWVVPIKARGRYALCSAINCAECVRRVRKGDFWKSELFAKDALTENNKIVFTPGKRKSTHATTATTATTTAHPKTTKKPK
jgi:hypothetical protein